MSNKYYLPFLPPGRCVCRAAQPVMRVKEAWQLRSRLRYCFGPAIC